MSKDAWKDTGNCSECRKRDYCKKQCSANKRYFKAHLFETLVKTYNERLGKKNGT